MVITYLQIIDLLMTTVLCGMISGISDVSVAHISRVVLDGEVGCSKLFFFELHLDPTHFTFRRLCFNVSTHPGSILGHTCIQCSRLRQQKLKVFVLGGFSGPY